MIVQISLFVACASSEHVIGLLHRWTSAGAELGDSWKHVRCAAELAVRHAQQRNGSVVPALANIPDVHRFTSFNYDTGSVPKTGLKARRQALKNNAQILIGAARSAVSLPLALVGAVDETPQISYWSSAPELSNKGE